MADLTQLIIDAVRSTAEEQGLEVPATLNAEARLFGEGGLLDSLALVSLVVAVEQAIAETFGKTVELADDKALSQKNSPYRSIATLAAYAQAQIG